jgi:hypothetical protein
MRGIFFLLFFFGERMFIFVFSFFFLLDQLLEKELFIHNIEQKIVTSELNSNGNYLVNRSDGLTCVNYSLEISVYENDMFSFS